MYFNWGTDSPEQRAAREKFEQEILFEQMVRRKMEKMPKPGHLHGPIRAKDADNLNIIRLNGNSGDSGNNGDSGNGDGGDGGDGAGSKLIP